MRVFDDALGRNGETSESSFGGLAARLCSIQRNQPGEVFFVVHPVRSTSSFFGQFGVILRLTFGHRRLGGRRCQIARPRLPRPTCQLAIPSEAPGVSSRTASRRSLLSAHLEQLLVVRVEEVSEIRACFVVPGPLPCGPFPHAHNLNTRRCAPRFAA